MAHITSHIDVISLLSFYLARSPRTTLLDDYTQKIDFSRF